jgi:hypothetical protein
MNELYATETTARCLFLLNLHTVGFQRNSRSSMEQIFTQNLKIEQEGKKNHGETHQLVTCYIEKVEDVLHSAEKSNFGPAIVNSISNCFD